MNHPLLIGTFVAASAALLAGASPAGPTTTPTTRPASPIFDYTMTRLDGSDQPLAKYAGKVVLIVNTASKCGFTKQYAGLEAVNKKYADRGLAVVGFPSDNFKNQEFGTDAEIATFCKDKFGVTFDLFSKVDVIGEKQVPLFQYLTSHAPVTGDIKWNFEKFLIGKDGTIVARFRSAVTPESPEVTKAIEAELAK